MNFQLTDEQKLLRESLVGFLQKRYDFDARRAAAANGGWRPEIWAGFADDLGLFGAALSEAEGGFGGGAVETMLIAEELGRALVMEPYLESVVVANALLRGTDAADLREGIVAGTALVVPALYETGGRFEPSVVTVRASGDGPVLDGEKSVVAAAPIATHLLVSAREEAGVSLFLVDAKAAGVSRRDFSLIDGKPASDVTFAAAPATRIGEPGTALPRIERGIDEGIAALCSEAVGVIDAMLARTVDYTKQREQFGVAIASFQALQHRMADMATLLERARSMSVMATLSLGLPVGERRRAVSAAKAFVGDTLKSVGEAAIQLHGGIGTTDDIAVSHYFKRATVMQSQFGTAAYHLKRMGDADAI
ncbi:acyl-CoA dehydrogenase family protein [Sphingomonas radiodurans]|uniref:acyl-CoA dehydrogenase family protein n=1 Tax=Sphingomonas radiodurans TaxID=2890321 RepID=UPI001E3413AE|nr:acyl-CoA dehydrogenase family protein [Sphingomonas radiodurans]WBH17775.1 acyl-CoA dehydrogenase family protein [Sphingomonas radiodurans]